MTNNLRYFLERYFYKNMFLRSYLFCPGFLSASLSSFLSDDFT